MDMVAAKVCSYRLTCLSCISFLFSQISSVWEKSSWKYVRFARSPPRIMHFYAQRAAALRMPFMLILPALTGGTVLLSILLMHSKALCGLIFLASSIRSA